MKKIIFTTIVPVLLCITAVFASDDGNTLILTRSKAIEIALKNSDDLKISAESLDKLNNIYKEVRSSIFPQVTSSLGIINYIESPVMEFDLGSEPVSIPLAEDWETKLKIQMSQVLWAFGKIMNAIRFAENYINLEKHSAEITKNELTYAVKQFYFTMLLAEDMVKIASESHRNALKNEKALKDKFKKGRTSRVNNIKMEADIAGRVPRVLQAQKSLDLVKVAFKDMLGIPDETTIILKEDFIEDFPEINTELLRKKMLEKEPMLMVYREKLKLADVKIKLKKSDFYPMLTGFLSYSYGGSGDNIIPEELNSEMIAGISLNYSIWDSGARKNAYKQAVNDKNIAGIEYSKKEKALEVRLKSALSEYNSLKKTYKANLTATDLAKKSYNIALSSFKAGIVSQTMLNDAELQLTGAKMAEKTTLLNINVLIAKIEKLITGKIKL